MQISIHDNWLISYEVHCEDRKIVLHTEFRAENKPTEFVDVVFTGVEGYHFENDAFGNIIFGVDPIPLDLFLEEYGGEILKSHRMAGAPGPWAVDIEKASEFLRQQNIQAFELSSSYGLSGWVLARDFVMLQTHGLPHPGTESQNPSS